MANDIAPTPHQTVNQILNSLPAGDFERLRPHIEELDLPSGRILFQAGEKIEHVYFPHGAMVSVVPYTPGRPGRRGGRYRLERCRRNRRIHGATSTINEHMIQLPNGGSRIMASVIRDEFERGGALQRSILSFTRLLMMQISQTALCNRLHSVEERLSCWLLMCRDRSDSDVLHLTQEFLSIMLGASRVAVTQAAIGLQERGFIEYRRGRIAFIDRKGMEDFTCDCYATIKKEFDRSLQSSAS